MPIKKSKPVDKVRASRAGHEYHEIWAARRAMQLLLPNNPLRAIAVEGLSPRDQANATAKTIEIADLTLYYGQVDFEHASRMTISQFKYSIASQDIEFRVTDAKETIEKFADSYRSLKRKHGAAAITEKLDFELVTNRPVYEPFQKAIEALKSGAPRSGDVLRQSKQFAKAAGLTGKALAEFAGKLTLTGLSGSLPAGKRSLAGLIVDWSGTDDLLASSRLGKIKDFVRDKAGDAGTEKNLIMRTDMLAEFGIENADDLLPCKAALPEVGKILEREQLGEAIALLPTLTVPLLVQATGGVGKTVFMESLASALSEQHETVFFDCFGGGAYRSASDARHLPKRGLIHIANTLAFRGLCDPILPGVTDTEALFRTFRRRLAQCVATLRAQTPGRNLVIFIDAIDNAQLFAEERKQEAFPTLLLSSLQYEPIQGVQLVVSCRPERKPTAFTGYEDFPLRPFSLAETTAYLKARLKGISVAQIKVAQARSGGNARVLEYLVSSDHGLLDESELNKVIQLDDLIQQRIDKALGIARDRGYQQKDIDAFLAGLATLPPPVPLDEYANANGMTPEEIESFASDLNPLLERTNHGLMFRDEPTETLIHNRYSSQPEALERVAANLLARQESSVYAARALPPLLQQLDDGERLFSLALDDRIPATITSTVGKRNIRYARIKSAVLHAANKRDYNKLVRLLVEISTVAAVDERGGEYISNSPDLVVAAKDADAMRRLFEARTKWPGSRHAKLAIANTLAGDTGDAYRHAREADEWLDHYYRRSDRRDPMQRVRPDRSYIAAVPLLLVCEGRPYDACRSLEGWRAWYSYEVSEHVFGYLHLAVELGRLKAKNLSAFLNSLTDTGSLAAALSFHDIPTNTAKSLIAKLAEVCKTEKHLSADSYHRKERTYDLSDGIRKASAIALIHGQKTEALTLCKAAPYSQPSVWSFRDWAFRGDIFPFVFRVAMIAAINDENIHERDLIPKDLVSLFAKIDTGLTGPEFVKEAKDAITKAPHYDPDSPELPKEEDAMSSDDKRKAEKFLDKQLPHLLALAISLKDVLTASSRTLDSRFLKLVAAWEAARKYKDTYGTGEQDRLFQMLGLEIAQFVLWARRDLKQASVARLLSAMHSQTHSAYDLIETIAVLAQRKALHNIAGEQAFKARTAIEAVNEVTERGTLFAKLSRAILPASVEEASSYFHIGLQQMDAIGSGDYEFTNDLLLFASSLKGQELDEQDFHTLSNIAELNLGDEPRKFFWVAYAKGMSKASGARGLAKLSRWDDRARIGLDNTLYPYLIVLTEDRKLEPELALALNRLADPVEYYEFGTTEFLKVLQAQGVATKPAIAAELVNQYLDDNPRTFNDATMAALAELAETVLGSEAEATKHLKAGAAKLGAVRDTKNEHLNYRGSAPDPAIGRAPEELDRQNREALDKIAKDTNPADEASLALAISKLDQLEHVYDLKGEFFNALREKVPFDKRSQYTRGIAKSEHLNWYWKIGELEECKTKWGASSFSVSAALKEIAIPTLRQHVGAIVEDGRFSGYKVKELSELTGVPMAALVLDLIKALAQPDILTGGAAWLGLASFIAPEADDGMGQLALKRLLNSEAASLANNVTDGTWHAGLYPDADIVQIASGLIWRQLGSPYAEDRWRATHSVRSLARFNRWDVIDRLVEHAAFTTAGPFQASELGFYYLHARVWLLIALGRVALDDPAKVARHHDVLWNFVFDDKQPHVLMRHFARSALIACVAAGALHLPPQKEKALKDAEQSPLPHLHEKIRKGGGFYHGRPKDVPEPEFEFHLDMDFHKQDVDNLAYVFGKGTWEVADLMSEIVKQLDPDIKSMYDKKGRDSRHNCDGYGMGDRDHSYGQQLGWHALFFAAGKLLKSFPVTDDWWGHTDSDPWLDWLRRYTLTREDGYWLSDGTDRTPLDTQTILLQKGKQDLELTGDQNTIQRLVNISSSFPEEIVIEGDWYSADLIRVSVSSALVAPRDAQSLAQKLLDEEPISAYVPTFQYESEDDDSDNESEEGYDAWVLNPFGEARLDRLDPLGVDEANRRPRLTRKYAALAKIAPLDPFGRTWASEDAKPVLRAEAWGRTQTDDRRESHPGLRLLLRVPTLLEILKAENKTLLLLVVLRRSEERPSWRSSTKWTHTVAAITITRNGEIAYLPGKINELHKDRW